MFWVKINYNFKSKKKIMCYVYYVCTDIVLVIIPQFIHAEKRKEDSSKKMRPTDPIKDTRPSFKEIIQK